MAGHDIEVSIDWGTWKWACAYVIRKNGKVIGTPQPLIIGEEAYEVRMMATWVNDRFVHGTKLQELANEDFAISDIIIEFFKLPLYRGPETSDISARVHSVLNEIPGGKTLDMLIEEHLQAIIGEIKEALKQSEAKIHFKNEAAWSKVFSSLRVRITVPQMWPPDARRRMQTAAKKAGLPIVVLAYEPQCALAWMVDRLAREIRDRNQHFDKGSSILMADLGCGTGDFITYELQSALSATSRLKAVGRSSGDICGSLQVDHFLYDSILQSEGRAWFTASYRKLGVTERDFKRRALVAIEEVKSRFGRTEQVRVGTIMGLHGENVQFQVTRMQLHAALDCTIGHITDRIDQHQENVRAGVIMVTGGFSKSSYLYEAVKARYEPQGIIVIRPNTTYTGECFPVAVGALLRYSNITTCGLPNVYSYAMLQRQVFDENVHDDSFHYETDPVTGNVGIRYSEWVLNDPYDPNVAVVDDRIKNILEKDAIPKPGQAVPGKFALIFFVPKEDPRITHEFVYMTKRFPENARAKVKNKNRHWKRDEEDQYVFREGVYPWASLDLPLPKEELEGKGFKTLTVDGKEFWELHTRAIIKKNKEDLQIGVDICKPGEKWDGRGSEKAFRAKVAFTVWEKIWDDKHSEFIDEQS